MSRSDPLGLRYPDSDCFAGSTFDAQRVLADMASALEFIHANKIVHNDLKPSNILYSPARGAVLINFGLSFMDGNQTSTGGTPGYLPPEFQFGWRTRGPQSDIWALGVVILWLLRYIPLPERIAWWSIADIQSSELSPRPYKEANTTMEDWIDFLMQTSWQLNEEKKPLTFLLRDMLAWRGDHRISAAVLNSLIVNMVAKGLFWSDKQDRWYYFSFLDVNNLWNRGLLVHGLAHFHETANPTEMGYLPLEQYMHGLALSDVAQMLFMLILSHLLQCCVRIYPGFEIFTKKDPPKVIQSLSCKVHFGPERSNRCELAAFPFNKIVW